MIRRLLLVLSLLAFVVFPTWAAEFAVVQSAAPTTTTTQDFTTTGFGTPLCALSMATYGTANGTTVDHAMLSIGATDGTRAYSVGMASEDAQTTSDTGNVVDNNSPIVTLLNTLQTKDGEASFDSFITNGIRYNWTDAPPAAYLINTLLIGGTITNCYVGSFTTQSSVDASTDVTGPGFQPDVVILFSHLGNAANARLSIGVVVRGDNQKAVSLNDTDAQASMTTRTFMSSNRSVASGPNAVPVPAILIENFDASGFSATLKDASMAAFDVGYLAFKLPVGMSAKVLTFDSPTSTGSHSVTGAGFTPQFGMVLGGEFAAEDISYNTDDSEVLGVGLFTASAQASVSYYTEDGDTDSNTESTTDGKPIHHRKDAADYMVATFTAFTSDGVTFNYTTTPGAAKKQAFLFVQASAGAGTSGVIKRRSN